MKRAWLILTLAAACTLGTGTFAGKTCMSNVECPDPYVCAQVRPEGRTCELLRGVETFDPTADNPAYYCNDVKPILDRSCISNCHGSDQSYVGTPHTFRLDSYGKVGVMVGAFEKASTLNGRIQADTMPPMVMGLSRPTLAERNIVLRWVNSGAPECAVTMDAGGGTPDAGSGDGGMRDGGDGG